MSEPVLVVRARRLRAARVVVAREERAGEVVGEGPKARERDVLAGRGLLPGETRGPAGFGRFFTRRAGVLPGYRCNAGCWVWRVPRVSAAMSLRAGPGTCSFLATRRVSA